MRSLLTCNLSTKTVLDGDAAWTPPIFQFNESLTVSLRFLSKVAGVAYEPTLEITAMRAAIGQVDARPESGTWGLQMGEGTATSANTAAGITHDATAGQLAAALNALTSVVSAYGTARVTKADGSYAIIWGTGTVEVPLTIRANTLFPASFGRMSAYQVDGTWVHSVRLTQAPVAMTTTGDRVLPPAPSVSRIQAGGSDGGFVWNEVQDLYLPPDFRGSYLLRWGAYARTAELSLADTASTVQAALVQAIGSASVLVTNPRDDHFRIEFINQLAASAQPLLVVSALEAPAGDFTFTLELDKAELLVLLQRADPVTLPLEVRLWTREEDGSTAEQVAFVQAVQIARPVLWPELATVPVTDYLRPPSPRDYVPFNAGTVITGQQYFPAVLGDGTATAFVVDHGLATEAVYVFVRENVDGGRQLIDGTDFRVNLTSANSVTVTALTGAPAAGAWAAVVMSAQTVAAFAAGLTVTIGQVTGLQTQLEAIGTQVAAVLALLPTTPAGVTSAGAGPVVNIAIPDRLEIYPGKSADGASVPSPLGGLLPAVHSATITALTGALPDVASSAGVVLQNNTGAALLLPGGMGTKGSALAVDGYAASDGRRWFPVSRSGSTNSYFPRDFERELFMFEVNAQMLRAGTTLTCTAKITLALLQAVTRAQYLLVVEHGTVPSQTSPAVTAVNLSDIAWEATPLLTQRLILGPVPVTHAFGFQLLRSGAGVLSANKILYGLATGADAVPASADVALRCRLMNFDTENSVPAPRGAVSSKLSEASASIS